MEKLRLLISKLVIGVVILSSLVICIGGGLYLWQHGHEVIHYHTFRGEPKPYTTFLDIWKLAFSFSTRGIIQLGLLLLVLGQSVRVALTLWLFMKEKDLIFSISSLIILVILLYSLLGL